MIANAFAPADIRRVRWKRYTGRAENRRAILGFPGLHPMGHRLSKIYTRTGDAGETGLGDGSRVPKDSPRVAALGEIDELNSCIGLLLAEALPETVRDALLGVQNDLFDLGGDVSIPGRATMTARQVENLEGLLDQFNAALPPLKEFILPGGS